MSDSKKQVLPDGFTDVKENLPAVKSHGSIASSSKHLILMDSNGQRMVGIYQRWDRDMNAPHFITKKGEGFFHDLEGTVLTNIAGFQQI